MNTGPNGPTASALTMKLRPGFEILPTNIPIGDASIFQFDDVLHKDDINKIFSGNIRATLYAQCMSYMR